MLQMRNTLSSQKSVDNVLQLQERHVLWGCMRGAKKAPQAANLRGFWGVKRDAV